MIDSIRDFAPLMMLQATLIWIFLVWIFAFFTIVPLIIAARSGGVLCTEHWPKFAYRQAYTAGDPRRALLALPGIRASRLPSEESLDRLERFLRANQPCDPTPVSCNENKRNELLKE